MFLPRCLQTTSSNTSRTSSAWSSAASTAPTVSGPIWWPPSTSSTSSSTTARAAAMSSSSPPRVSRLPRSAIVQCSRSRSASRTPSSTPASSAATSFETSSTCWLTALSVGRGQARELARREASGELLFDELAHNRPVGATGDLVHDARHDPPHVADARRADLGDDVVDDLLELLLGHRLRHELLEDLEFVLLVLRLLLAACTAERLGSFEPALALTLEHLELLVVRERALELLLRVL